MGIAPDGSHQPNGTDFWWDSFPGNAGNCWFGNTSYKPITTSPSPLPDCDGGADPSSSMGTGNVANEGELAVCAIPFVTGDLNPEGSQCPWFVTPPKPTARTARAENAEQRAAMRRAFVDFCDEVGATATCDPFEPLLPGD